MENVAVLVNPKEFGLEENKALELTVGLNPILEERALLIEEFNKIKDLEVNEENISLFRALRIKFQKNRTQGVDKWHSVTKEVPLRMSQLIDAVKRNENLTNKNYENPLEEKEKFFENLEKARLKAIHEERVSKLLPFNYEIGNVDFSAMDENMFNAILLGAETNHKAKLEAERLAEEQRLETIRLEAEEKEKQRVEMERLKAENEAKEKQLKEEKAKADTELAEQKKLADIEAKKQADIIAKQKAELKAKADAELMAKEKAEAEAAKLAKAPVKKQLTVWVESFELPTTSLDSEITKEIKSKFEAFKNWSLTQINNI